MDPYFVGGRIEVFDSYSGVQNARIQSLQVDAEPFKRFTATARRTASIAPGDIARWRLPAPTVKNGLLHAPACDDLAGAAAALSALDTIRRMPRLGNVGVLLTKAEEIGFVGAIAAASNKTIPKKARLLCLETSRTFPESPIGAGPILRVGDKTSVFGPELTNRIAEIMQAHTRDNPRFSWQRKLMPGGTCEATAFCNYGYLSTCLCLALGNYHNMHDIDGVAAGKRPAKIAPEVISIDDYHGLVEMLVVTCQHLGGTASSAMRRSLEERLRKFERLLQSSS
jgi:endoglucanase